MRFLLAGDPAARGTGPELLLRLPRATPAAAPLRFLAWVLGDGTTSVSAVLFALGLLTFAVFLIGWVAYMVWRSAAAKDVCPSCNSVGAVIPLSTPLGRRLVRDSGSNDGEPVRALAVG